MIDGMNERGKKTMPKVSFIIPTLNAERYLERCLKTIREQEYPENKIEVVIADGGSIDRTLKIAKKYKAKVIKNPDILHEPGKTRASKVATGTILFYTDADNILATKNWIRYMVKPYIEQKKIKGFLPQTIPAKDSNTLDRYFGHLFTDPLTWFVYGNAANPRDYKKVFTPVVVNSSYTVYKFSLSQLPLFGLSQGVGTTSSFHRDKIGANDDLLAGMKLIQEGGLIAYVPKAGVYHYHIAGLSNFIKKYRWRIRNNLTREVKGMGIMQRKSLFDNKKKLRLALFIPYGLSFIFPSVDAIKLVKKHHDLVMLWHIPASFILSMLVIYEYILYILNPKNKVGNYE